MTVTTGPTTDDTRRRQLALLTELREVDHWRRLVAARLDLAVAAVAAVDEPVVRNLPAAPAPPFGLRELVGLPAAGQARSEAGLLLRLRAAQRDLDAYAAALRATTRGATYELLSRLDDHRGLPDCPHTGLPDAPPDVPADTPLAPVLPLRRRGRHRREGPDGAA
jgi:hypothetical protein